MVAILMWKENKMIYLLSVKEKTRFTCFISRFEGKPKLLTIFFLSFNMRRTENQHQKS